VPRPLIRNKHVFYVNNYVLKIGASAVSPQWHRLCKRDDFIVFSADKDGSDARLRNLKAFVGSLHAGE